MGWITRFFASRGNVTSTAKWACVQYKGLTKLNPTLRDRLLVESIIDLRYSTFVIDPEKEERLRDQILGIKDLADLAYAVLAVENDDDTATSPFRNLEWVETAIATIRKVVGEHGLQDVSFDYEN